MIVYKSISKCQEFWLKNKCCLTVEHYSKVTVLFFYRWHYQNCVRVVQNGNASTKGNINVLTFFTITTFRTFYHLSVICVVYSDSKILSEQKMELTRENFRVMIYYDFRRGLSRQESYR